MAPKNKDNTAAPQLKIKLNTLLKEDQNLHQQQIKPPLQAPATPLIFPMHLWLPLT